MRKIERNDFISRIKSELIDSAYYLPSSVLELIKKGRDQEVREMSKHILDQIVENEAIARTEHIPLCQDTGVAIVTLKIGCEVSFDFLIEDAVNVAVREAYQEGYLRKSVVDHPLSRKNTLDNTPAIVHIKQALGDQVEIYVAPKGAGSENMSRLSMLSPSAGKEGIINFVLETVKLAGGKACPPIILGIGIGGNFEKSALIAKEALFRELDDEAENPVDRELEKELFEKVNLLNVGPMGLGGVTSCLAVKVNSYPCHIASLPVAVNIQCHSARKRHFFL
ncbi:MAG: fumarate hydratase [Candidatus Izemoplasmatales bacterium]